MQQGGTSTAGGAPSLSTSTISAKPGISSAPATWHVPLQHCGVHWVRANEALAAALVSALWVGLGSKRTFAPVQAAVCPVNFKVCMVSK